MMAIRKQYAVDLLARSVKLLGRGDAESQALAAEISDAIKLSLYAIAAKEYRMAAKAERVEMRAARKPYQINPESQQRYEKIGAQFIAGVPVLQIAQEFGVSGQRIRQIAARLGLERPRGVRSGTKIRELKESRRRAADARCMAKWGVDWQGMKALRLSGVLEAYNQQRNAARSQGKLWNLSFIEWHRIWLESGMLDKRGRGKGRYVMARKDHSKPYEAGNVQIITYEQNIRNVRERTLGNISPIPGVYCLYPGLSKPWIAKARGKQIGSFESAALALAARNEAIAQAA